MPALLALDQGTTSSRSILFDLEGAVLGVAQREFAQHFPRPGWVEHDPEEIWRSQSESIGEVLASGAVAPADVLGVGITNQRETTIVWERASGRPIANAIVWQDRRTSDACARLERDGAAEFVRARTGLVIDPYFSATKIAWLLDHVRGARARAEAGELCFGTIDTWLVWRLTGGAVHVTDASNAARTMLCDIHRLEWDDELLELFGVPRAMLPAICSSSEVYGQTVTSECPLDVPIAGMAGDQQAALFGQICHAPGLAKNTYGTGCFMLLNTGDEAVASKNKLLTTVGWRLGDRTTYALEGSVFIGGALVQWLRDGLGIIESASEIEPLARSVEDTGGVCIVPALAGLGAPHWDPFARGAILGLTRGTTRAHLARAALEAIAHQVTDVLEAMHDDASLDIAELRVDGGATANDLLMQIQADLLGLPIVRPRVTETTALGAALLAGLALDAWPDTGSLARTWTAERRFEPDLAQADVRRHRARWAEAIDRARAWVPPESKQEMIR